MARKENNWIFPAGGKYPIDKTIIPGEEAIKKGMVDGAYFIDTGRFDVSWRRLGEALGIYKSGIKKAPRAPEQTYSGKSIFHGSDAVGDVAYKMIKDEAEADGYNVVELTAAELEGISPEYKSPFGAEDSDVGGKNIYVVTGNPSEKMTEVLYHEWRAKKLVETRGGNHTDYHGMVESEQVAATKKYMSRAMEALKRQTVFN